MSGIVLITGASRGIGAATALLAAERGYDVCVNYRSNTKPAAELVERIRSRTRAIAVCADVSVEADVVRLFETIDAELGPLTALVNNAGVLERQTRVEAMRADRLQRVFAVNIIGAMLCCREAVRRMSRAHGGSGGAIVNVSSMAARLGSPNEYVDYAASKRRRGHTHDRSRPGSRIGRRARQRRSTWTHLYRHARRRRRARSRRAPAILRAAPTRRSAGRSSTRDIVAALR